MLRTSSTDPGSSSRRANTYTSDPTKASGPRPNIAQNARLTSTTSPPIAMIMIPAAAWLKTAPKRESSTSRGTWSAVRAGSRTPPAKPAANAAVSSAPRGWPASSRWSRTRVRSSAPGSSRPAATSPAPTARATAGAAWPWTTLSRLSVRAARRGRSVASGSGPASATAQVSRSESAGASRAAEGQDPSDVIGRSAFRTARGATVRRGERVTLPSRHPTRRARTARTIDTRPASELRDRRRTCRRTWCRSGGPPVDLPDACLRW
jgi:hypothetical protein